MPADSEIRSDAAYAQQDFLDRVGLGRAAFRTARKDGLISHGVGNKKFILGSDWLKFLEGK